jgi:hypothetical protein
MSSRALTLYDSDSDSDASTLAGDSRPVASMSIGNDPCRRDNDSDRFYLDSDLETNYSDSEEEYITSEQAQKYNPAGLRVEARRTLNYDSDSDDDGDANRGYNAQTVSGFNRSVMGNGMRDDESSIGSDDDYDPIITGRTDLPRAFVSSDKELDANLPVGRARDKVTTTSTINAETGEKEIVQFREGEQERPSRRVRIVSSAKQSAEIVAGALAKARADKTKVVKATGGEGEATLTEAEKKKVIARTKLMGAVKAGAKEVKKQSNIDKASAEMTPERQAEVVGKEKQMVKKKALVGEIKEGGVEKVKSELRKAETGEQLAKVEGQVKAMVDKRMLGEAFKRMKAEAQARAVLKTIAGKVARTVARGKIRETFKRILLNIKGASAEMEEQLRRQSRQQLADLLSKRGVELGEEEDVGEAGKGDDPRSVAISSAKAEVERMSAEVEPINYDGKALEVRKTEGGHKKLYLGGINISGNAENLPTLEGVQKELAKTRNTDPLARAIKDIVDKLVYTARSSRGKGKAGGQGKRSTTPAKGGAGGGGGGGGGGADVPAKAPVRRKLRVVSEGGAMAGAGGK